MSRFFSRAVTLLFTAVFVCSYAGCAEDNEKDIKSGTKGSAPAGKSYSAADYNSAKPANAGFMPYDKGHKVKKEDGEKKGN